VEEVKNMDDENFIAAFEEEQLKVCPVCGDVIDNSGKCCDKCMLDLVGVS